MKSAHLAITGSLAALSLLCACAQAPAMSALSEDARPAVDRIEATYQTWGRLREAWTIQRGGEGSHVLVADPFAEKPEQTARTFAVSPTTFDSLRKTLLPTEQYAGDDSKCTLQITDGPYGSVTWYSGETKVHAFAWRAGYACPGKDKALDSMDAAYRAVIALAKAK